MIKASAHEALPILETSMGFDWSGCDFALVTAPRPAGEPMPVYQVFPAGRDGRTEVHPFTAGNIETVECDPRIVFGQDALIEIDYTYADASNFKQHESVTVPITATPVMLAKLLTALHAADREFFIPSEIGLEDLYRRFDRLCEDDGVYHTVGALKLLPAGIPDISPWGELDWAAIDRVLVKGYDIVTATDRLNLLVEEED